MSYTKTPLTICFGLIMLSACAQPPTTTEVTAGWVLPLDDYYVESTSLVDRAIVGHYIECATGEKPDIEYTPAWEDEGPVFGPSGRRLFNLDIAHAYGYSFGPEILLAPTELDEVDLSIAMESPCWEQALESVPSAPDIPLAFSLAADAYNVAKMSDVVREATMHWASCMAKTGLLPDGVSEPADMPGRDGDFNPYYQPEAAEVQLAVADATCRTESEYDKTLFQEEKHTQQAAIAEHQGELTHEKEQLTQLRAWARGYFD